MVVAVLGEQVVLVVTMMVGLHRGQEEEDTGVQ